MVGVSFCCLSVPVGAYGCYQSGLHSAVAVMLIDGAIYIMHKHREQKVKSKTFVLFQKTA